MCGLKRRALVTFACVALAVFLAASYLATREDRAAARLTRAPRLRERRADGGTAEGDAWLEEWQRAHGVDTRLAHETRARAEHDEAMASSSSGHDFKSRPRAHHVVAAGKHHNKRYSLRGSLEAKETEEREPSDVESDPSLSAALKSMRVPPGSLVALTFADKKMLAMVLNWSAHLRRLNVPHLVGALDDHTKEVLESRDVLVFRCVFAEEALDGGSGHDSGNWKTFAATRIAKIRAALELGYDVLMSDADVVWRRDPRHYLQCPEMAVDTSHDAEKGVSTDGSDEPGQTRKRSPCESIAAADVMVSSDNLSPKTDARLGASYARGGVFNTGVVFLKHTPGAKAFAKAWSWHLSATVGSRNDRYARLTSDQQVFNAMTRRKDEWPGIDPVDHHTEVPGVVNAPTRVLEAILGLSNDEAAFDGFKTFKLGVLPVAAFQPGHVAFLQKTNEMDPKTIENAFAFDGAREDERAGAVRDNEPYCVHATYTFDGSTPFAKRFRFAEFGLWDPESDQIESSASGENFRDDFLFRDDASGGKTSERKFLTYDPLSALETVFGVPFETFATFEPDIGRHLKAGAAQLRALRDAMAIAKVLNRTLAVPAPFCFCDKVWGGHDNIFAFNCHYPGSADSAHMPGACPLDHFVSPTAMRDAGVDFVAHGELPFFLEKTDTVLEVVAGADAVKRERGGVSGGGASETETEKPSFRESDDADFPRGKEEKDKDKDAFLPKEARSFFASKGSSVSIPAFATETQIKNALVSSHKSLRDAALVRLSNALDAFGGFDDDATNESFEKIVDGALRPEQWCSECHPRGCKAYIDAETLKLGTLHVVREVHDQFCATFEKPRGFKKKETRFVSERRTESTSAESTKLHDADGDDVVFRTPGSPPADDEIAAAGW